MNLLALPAFANNAIRTLHAGARAGVVDPDDAAPVLQALERLKLELACILVTHQYGHHEGGIEALGPPVPVHSAGRIACVQRSVAAMADGVDSTAPEAELAAPREWKNGF